jgi:hypothetical protein
MRIAVADCRVLGPTGIEDYHAHLLRLELASKFQFSPIADDAAIGAHCLNLIGAHAILIGAFVDGVMRGGAEILPDRSARCAAATCTVEEHFAGCGLEGELIAVMIEQARRHRLAELALIRCGDEIAIRRVAARSGCVLVMDDYLMRLCVLPAVAAEAA